MRRGTFYGTYEEPTELKGKVKAQEALNLASVTGRTYMGFRNQKGQRDGYGVMKGKDGTVYAGQWVSERRHGQGALIFGGGVFEGQWVRGRVHGEGIVHFKNGDIFRGWYNMNQKHGFGVYKWADGAEEVGEYAEGTKHGWHSWRHRREAWDLLYEKGVVVSAECVPHSGLRASPRPYQSGAGGERGVVENVLTNALLWERDAAASMKCPEDAAVVHPGSETVHPEGPYDLLKEGWFDMMAFSTSGLQKKAIPGFNDTWAKGSQEIVDRIEHALWEIKPTPSDWNGTGEYLYKCQTLRPNITRVLNGQVF